MANTTCLFRVVREGLIYRSARPGAHPFIHLDVHATPSVQDWLTIASDNASPEDMVYLAESLGIRTVIDLRTEYVLSCVQTFQMPSQNLHADKNRRTRHSTELARQAAKRLKQRLTNPSLPESPHIPGVQYHEIKVTGRSFERHIASLLTWWQFLYVFIYLFISWLRQRGGLTSSPQALAGQIG